MYPKSSDELKEWEKSLVSCPPEVRNLIYKHIVKLEYLIEYSPEHGLRVNDANNVPNAPLLLGMILNEQLTFEICEAFYRENWIEIDAYSVIDFFFTERHVTCLWNKNTRRRVAMPTDLGNDPVKSIIIQFSRAGNRALSRKELPILLQLSYLTHITFVNGSSSWNWGDVGWTISLIRALRERFGSGFEMIDNLPELEGDDTLDESEEGDGIDELEGSDSLEEPEARRDSIRWIWDITDPANVE